MSMDIHTPAGAKVIVTATTANNGHENDLRKVAKYLKIGKQYTVKGIHVGDWMTLVELEEHPCIAFNSVNFDNL